MLTSLGELNEEALKASFASSEVRFIRVAYADMHGVSRGKSISRAAFPAALTHGIKSCCGIFSKDLVGRQLIETDYMWQRGAEDNLIRPVPETYHLLSWREHCAQIIGDVYAPDGRPLPRAPRHILRRMVTRFEELGWAPRVGAELEFYLFDADGNPVSAGNQAYSFQKLAEAAVIVEPLMAHLYDSGVPIESFHVENDGGQIELVLAHRDALEMADWIFLTRQAIKEIALKDGYRATFMPLPQTGVTPSGLHLNVSLRDIKNERNGFVMEAVGSGEHPNELLANFLAGTLHNLHAALPLLMPTINGFKAARADSFFPLQSTWGRDNRSVALRVPETAPHACRIEHRIPTSDCNPYLGIATVLALGLSGLTHKLTLPAPITGNASKQEDLALLDFDFERALLTLQNAKWLSQLLGEEFVSAFVALKQSELHAFRGAVTDWERATYEDML